MLQWKSRFLVLLILAIVAVAVFGGYASDQVLQFGW